MGLVFVPFLLMIGALYIPYLLIVLCWIRLREWIFVASMKRMERQLAWGDFLTKMVAGQGMLVNECGKVPFDGGG